MKRKSSLYVGLALLMFGGAGPARAETTQEILAKLPGLIHADAVARKAKGGNGAEAMATAEETQRNNTLNQVREMLAQNNDTGAESFMQNFLGADASETLRVEALALVPQYRTERTARENAAAAE